MRVRMFVLSLFVLLTTTPAFTADDMDEFNLRLSQAKGRAEQVAIQKEIGDYHVVRSDFGKAAEAYLKALPDLRDQLTEDQWTQMAIHLSWGGKLDGAILELQAILKKNQANTPARAQLAVVYLWTGNLDGALSEAEVVLKKLPDDRDTLRVKADVLRLQGNTDGAIAIYKVLLQRSDDFDSRLGLSYAYLRKGDLAQAQTESSSLRPIFPYQKQELEKWNQEFKQARQSQPPPRSPAAVKADMLKEEGDRLAAQEQLKAAAERYEGVLALSHDYPTEEWFRMARIMSWGGKHKAARQELELILAKEPSNLEARLQHARVLLWTGEFDAGIRQAEMVLKASPDNREALLVKATGLRLKGFHRDADRLYNALLAQGENFDARLGLTYGYLTRGDRVRTDEGIERLKPAYPYQEKDQAQIRKDRDWAYRPRIYTGVNFYEDNDNNRVATYSVGGQAYFGNWRTNLDYRHARATIPDPELAADSDTVQLSTYSRMPWYGGIGGGIGLADGHSVTWNARADLDVLYGSAGVSVGNEAYTYTAELINKNIHALTAAASVIQRPTDRITLRGGYTYRDYSDDNHSHDFQAGIAYLFWRKPATAIGYRFRYLDFQRQSFGGYFDPDNYVANSIFVNLSFEENRLYGYIEPYIGYQTYSRYEENQEGTFYGVMGMIGYRLTDRVAIEGTAEWGDSAEGVAVGGAYRYYQLGARLIVSF